MPDEPVAIRRKIGLERRYDGREYTADALTLLQNLSFRHHQTKPRNSDVDSSELICLRSINLSMSPVHANGSNGFPNLVVIDRSSPVRLTHTGYNSSETSFGRNLTRR